MAAIVRHFIRTAGGKPFIIAPIVNGWYMRFAAWQGCWRRFSSFDDGKMVKVIDLLPYFLRLGRRADDCYFERDGHLIDFGHAVMAEAMAIELRRPGLLSSRGGSPAGKEPKFQNDGRRHRAGDQRV